MRSAVRYQLHYRVYRNCRHGANFFTRHTDHIAGRVHRYRIKRGRKAGGQRAHPHTGTTFQAGIPINLKGDRVAFGHKVTPSDIQNQDGNSLQGY